MKLFIFFYLILLSTLLYAQKNEVEQAIVDEGIKLYKSEMASWNGTDIFLEKYPERRSDIGGYFSYSDPEGEKCIFYTNFDIPVVMATITFDSTFDVSKAKIDDNEREFTDLEHDLYVIRDLALKELQTDTFFQYYKNTNFNIIPIIEGSSKKVFVLTGPQISGVVIFGNDYLMTFDQDNKLITKKQLHHNIIPIEYGEEAEEDGKELAGTMHTHLGDTGDLITSTDICTLMLYASLANWKSHVVVSEKYMSIWTVKHNSLAVIERDVWEKINNSTEKKDEKSKKK